MGKVPLPGGVLSGADSSGADSSGADLLDVFRVLRPGER
jgi:hypothetical protein